jgi:two-component system, cell cycle sensor histidine kinase and response regulator CckA
MTNPAAQPNARVRPPRKPKRPGSSSPVPPAFASLLDANGAAFRALLENSRDGINFCELSLAGDHPARRLVFCNESFVEMAGRPLEELLACPDLNSLLEDDASPAQRAEYLGHLRAGKSFQGIGRWLRPDGRENVHEWVTVPIRLGDKHYVLGIDRDVTERVRAQATLTRERAEALMIFNSVPALIWYKDTHNRILRVNRAAAAAIGKQPWEIEGCTTEEIYPEEAAAYYRDDLEVIRSRRAKFGIAESLPGADGGKRWVITNKVPQLDEHGEVVGLVVVAQDVTTLKEAEEMRFALERKMQETQRLESLGVLAGGIAHDFNNLLTGIIGNASLARLEIPADSRTHRLFGQIEKASTRAADLCREMLAYAGKGRFQVEGVNLSAIVTETTHLLQSSIDKNTTLRFHLAADLPAVLADATQIRQVIMNLVLNASEAMGGQAGEVTVVTGHVQADREFLDDAVMAPDLPTGDYAFLEVTDKGCGMSPATAARVFDPFFTTKFTGRGLGLAAVLGIVRGHRGALKVRSKLGSGTTFQILLPCVTEGGVAAPASPERSVNWRGSGTVLLVDDEETVRNAGKSMLESFGFEVLTAENGREALRIFRDQDHQIAAVLLDLTMPQMDGEETFRELRQLQADVKVALMSGYNEQDATQHFIGRGLAAFVQKPFDVDSLRRTLQDLAVGQQKPKAS